MPRENVSPKPDPVQVSYEKTNRNCLHFYITAAHGQITIPYEIIPQTIKLIISKVSQKMADNVLIMFFKCDFIGGNQAVSNVSQNSLPIIYDASLTESFCSMQLSITCNTKIKRNFSYSVVDETGTLIDFSKLNYIQLVFEYEHSEIR